MKPKIWGREVLHSSTHFPARNSASAFSKDFASLPEATSPSSSASPEMRNTHPAIS